LLTSDFKLRSSAVSWIESVIWLIDDRFDQGTIVACQWSVRVPFRIRLVGNWQFFEYQLDCLVCQLTYNVGECKNPPKPLQLEHLILPVPRHFEQWTVPVEDLTKKQMWRKDCL